MNWRVSAGSRTIGVKTSSGKLCRKRKNGDGFPVKPKFSSRDWYNMRICGQCSPDRWKVCFFMRKALDATQV